SDFLMTSWALGLSLSIRKKYVYLCSIPLVTETFARLMNPIQSGLRAIVFVKGDRDDKQSSNRKTETEKSFISGCQGGPHGDPGACPPIDSGPSRSCRTNPAQARLEYFLAP